MRHLTHTGYYAGKTICGTPRNESDIYQHYQYTHTIEHLTDLCTRCKQIYMDMDNNDPIPCDHCGNISCEMELTLDNQHLCPDCWINPKV